MAALGGSNKSMGYAGAGVDRDAADRLVDRIAILAKSTLNRRVKASIGGYASLFELDPRRWLAASTDGVGTKLKLAFALGEHRTVGIDLVAMSVNDLLCVGAEPLFFLDYFATGKLDSGVAERVLEGIVAGCRLAGCALVGGETAEMPDFYAPGEYDLGGFAVGFLSPKEVLPSQDPTVRPGDLILGLRSSGCHSNGYSLLRKLLPEDQIGVDPEVTARARQLLEPTRIYSKSLQPLIRKRLIKGLAHITGSGFMNIPRISSRVSYEITLPERSKLPEVYGWIRHRGRLPFSELAQTFNLGIGMVCIVDPRKLSEVVRRIRRSGETVFELGRVVKKTARGPSQVILRESEADGGDFITLDY